MGSGAGIFFVVVVVDFDEDVEDDLGAFFADGDGVARDASL